MTTAEILNSAKKTKAVLSSFSPLEKNEALLAMADALENEKEYILAENAKDVEAAKGTVSDVMIDRLMLSEARITGMADGIRAVAKLPDPVGKVLESITRPNGLLIEKVSVPLGVVAIIYESRPNVTSDAAALCLKSLVFCAAVRKPTHPRTPSWKRCEKDFAMSVSPKLPSISLTIPHAQAQTS